MNFSHPSLKRIFKRLVAQLMLGVFITTTTGQVVAQTTNLIPGMVSASTANNIPSSLPPGVSTTDARALLQQSSAPANAGSISAVGRKVTIAEQVPAWAQNDRSFAPPLRPEENPSEYQRFVSATVGEFLPKFGHKFFTQVTELQAVQAVPTSGTYVIGPGDEITLKTWGSIDLNLKLIVNREGMIDIPNVGPVRVAGLPFAALKQHLFEQLSSAYKGFELAVDIGNMKGIQVYVVGNARAPGTYTVSSAGTLLNALFAAGGPSANGSMRKVQLKRGGSVVTEFDLYDFLVFGNVAKDARLSQGDVIFIPPVGPEVAVAGSVKNPAIYELRGDNASINEVIKFAGGLTATASRQTLTIERIDNKNERKKIDIPTSALFQKTHARYGQPLSAHDGDILIIGPLTRDLITITGFVERPMRFAWHSGMRVRDLIPDRNYLTTPDFWKQRNQLIKEKAVQEGQTTDLGEIRQQNSVAWNYAVIERLEPDLTSNLIPFNLGKAIAGDPEQNIVLQQGDIIRIFSKTDLRVPPGNERQFVRLEGEFVQPGVYAVEPGETLRQLIARTGGLNRNAYLYAGEFTRPSVQALQQKQLDEYAKSFEIQIKRASSEANQSATILKSEDMAMAQQQIQASNALLEKVKSTKAQGRIVLDFANANVTLADLPDLPLEDGDRFYVPRRPATVGVYGAVFAPSNFIYKDNSTVGDYLSLAGGYTRSSDKGYVYVLHADGSLRSAAQSWLTGLGGEAAYAGDAIIVPDLIVRGPTFMKQLMDWTTIIYQLGLAAAGIALIYRWK